VILPDRPRFWRNHQNQGAACGDRSAGIVPTGPGLCMPGTGRTLTVWMVPAKKPRRSGRITAVGDVPGSTHRHRAADAPDATAAACAPARPARSTRRTTPAAWTGALFAGICDGLWRSGFGSGLEHLPAPIHAGLEIDVVRTAQLAGILVFNVGRPLERIGRTAHPTPGGRCFSFGTAMSILSAPMQAPDVRKRAYRGSPRAR